MVQSDDRKQSAKSSYLYYRKWRRYSARPQCILVECGPLKSYKDESFSDKTSGDSTSESALSCFRAFLTKLSSLCFGAFRFTCVLFRTSFSDKLGDSIRRNDGTAERNGGTQAIF